MATTPLYTAEEIHNFYFPRTDDDVDDTAMMSGNRRRRTLHDSASRPGRLSHVLLFDGAHPHWRSSGTIYVKSRLDLLQQCTNVSIAIFSQERHASSPPAAESQARQTERPWLRLRLRSGAALSHLRFRFLGYYHVSKVTVLYPAGGGGGADADELKVILAAKDRARRAASAGTADDNDNDDDVVVVSSGPNSEDEMVEVEADDRRAKTKTRKERKQERRMKIKWAAVTFVPVQEDGFPMDPP